jgi:hypothetical protein
MDETTKTLRQQLRQTVIDGDLKRLKSLVVSFPEAFESLRYENFSDKNLVDLAWNAKNNDIVVYLIAAHHFEASPEFERERKRYSGELFADGVNEFHQTMELLANAAVNASREADKRDACYTIKGWAGERGNESSIPLNSEFIEQARNGNLAKFAQYYAKDSRPSLIPRAHSVGMIEALNQYAPNIQQRAIQSVSNLETVKSISVSQVAAK